MEGHGIASRALPVAIRTTAKGGAAAVAGFSGMDPDGERHRAAAVCLAAPRPFPGTHIVGVSDCESIAGFSVQCRSRERLGFHQTWLRARERFMIKRRAFLRNGVLGAGALLVSKYSSFAWAASAGAGSKIEILPDEPLGMISANLYGHFAENLGGVIYDGIWVGQNSSIPNIDGIRKELVEHMRTIKAPVIRYPGGCFADSYDWRDGIGPADSVRAARISGKVWRRRIPPRPTNTIPTSSARMSSSTSVS